MTPHKVGETKISVVYGKYKVSTTVKVIPQLKEIIAPKEVELYENTASSLAISTNPVRFDDLKSAKYQTSDKNVATISKDGTITTKSVGECYITITYGKVSSKTKVIVKPYKNSEVKILKDSVNISSDYDLRNLLEGDYDSEKIQYYHDNNVIIKNHQFIVQKAGQYMVGIKYNDDTTYVEINVVDEKNNEEIDVEGLVKKILGIVSGMLKELLQ